jgi:TonB family protein
MLAILLMAGAASLPPLSAESDLLSRAYALESGSSSEAALEVAAQLYQQAAQQGDAYAHFRLGLMRETGMGLPHDYGQARQHYEQAISGGVEDARVRLAMFALEGWGEAQNRSKFVSQLTIAAEAGNVTAQVILSDLYRVGIHVKHDPKRAIEWMETAARQDNPQAQHYAGVNTEKTRDRITATNRQLARTWYELSAEQEYTIAMRAMARTFLTGDPTDQDWQMTKQWLEIADEFDDKEAPYTLAILGIMRPEVAELAEDEILNLLQRGSDRGNFRAGELLELYIEGRSLSEAARHVLQTPFMDRYTQAHRKSVAAISDTKTRPPMALRLIPPLYPTSMRLAEEEGKVLIDFVVDTTGRVRSPIVLESTHPAFSEKALHAVRRWRFDPGIKEGRLVNTKMRIPVIFAFSDESMLGVDDFLNASRDMAERLGPEAAADAEYLRLAEPLGPGENFVPFAEGQPKPDAVSALLIRIDDKGTPIRGHILHATDKPSAQQQLHHAMGLRYRSHESDIGSDGTSVILTFKGQKMGRTNERSFTKLK